ncbi:MAG: hypothetical protein ACREM2_10860 [Vulcanimicrobiaceae bacterium]
MIRPLARLALAGALLAASAAPALADPTPAATTLLNNPYVQSAIQALGGIFQSTNGNTAHGSVTYFRRFELQVETAPHVYREVHLHQGTIIDPRGTTLRPGMIVEISGRAQPDGSLDADSIVTR